MENKGGFGLSNKQYDFLMSDLSRITILYGSVRSGKTFISLLKFALWVGEQDKHSEFIMVGRTITALKRNCFNLLTELVGENNFTFNLSQKKAELFGRTVWLEGASDSRAEGKIRGLTLTASYIDEATLIPRDFFDMLLSRLSVKNAKMICTTNPDQESHWLKTDFIDNPDLDKKIWHFTMDDNDFLDPDYKEQIKKEYKGVFYKMFVEGNFCTAEGLIFRYFADNPEPYIFDNTYSNTYSKIVIGIDFGGNGSMTTFCATGYANGYDKLYVLEEDSLPITQEIDSKKICDKFIDFYRRILDNYGKVSYIFPDCASPTMINSLRTEARMHNLKWNIITGCHKNHINERPKTIDMLFNTGRLYINRNCKNTIKALSSLVWDDKKPDQPQDLNSGNINDIYDAFTYTFTSFSPYIEINK